MKSVKAGKTNKVGKNTETANTKANKETHFKQANAITNIIRSIGGFFTKIVKKVRELVKKHPEKSSAALVVLTHAACKRAKELDDKVQDKSKQAEKENQINWWKYSGLTIATSLLLAACSVGDTDKQIELEQEKQKTSNIETNNQIKVEQEKQKTSNIEINNQIKVEQEKQKTSNIETNNQIKVEQEQQKTEQEKQKTNNTQKDLINKAEQNCQENHSQFFIKKLGIKGGIAIEIEAECKTPKPTKTNQTPIQPKHLPNSKQPHSQRGSKVQELIAYLQKELESLPYSQKAIAKQVDFYRPSSIAYLELDPRDFKVTEEWQKENLKIRSKAQAKMLEMRNLKPDPQAHLSASQSLLFVQKIFADVNKEIKVVANTEKKVEKAGYGYSKRM
ncbi:DUF874 family protein [Helicobacter pylori]|uniref:DUF874 family protein n=2 Tax=Helicobacter pylori TaxID=210 RepID=UPI00059CBEB5|nr:DUF874 family protein [Helicobacter pylori]AVG83368.1 DUF874 domain-containing protein [Helicobacter pylori]AVG84791.1 DUF874 domain-containing protein [Helicobacter pylori]AVG86275.1 DUF874 domain-containing protein [Helicobacter pylori]AVG87758.1 DUF874 domain-containing protein [Helicobacter pylori]AVG89242.1 DUF874 domain-containing protein [Helicobacter pylori]